MNYLSVLKNTKPYAPTQMQEVQRISFGVIICHEQTNGLLLLDTRGNYSIIELSASLDNILTEENLPDVVTHAVSELLESSVKYVSILDFKIDGAPLILYFLLSTNDLGKTAVLSRNGFAWLEEKELSPSNSSSLLLSLVHKSVEISQRQKMGLSIASLGRAVNKKAISFVSQKMNKPEIDKVGWTQYLGTDLIGSLSTAQGILCYLHARVSSPFISMGITTIRKLQNTDGGWPVLKALVGRSNISITESTLFSLWALLEAGYSSKDESILKAINWLEQVQRPSGGWGSSENSSRERVYPSAFAIRVLSQVDSQGNTIKTAVAWLQSARNRDGGWGVFSSEGAGSRDVSDALHTSHAILALISAGIPVENSIIQDGIKFILSKYSKDIEEGWQSESEVEYVDGDSALDFRHYSTPWCIIALIKAGVPLYQEIVLHSYSRLIAAQHSLGYWTNKLVPGQIPIWATHDCLFALNQLVETVSLRLDLIVRTIDLEDELKILQKTVIKTQKSARLSRQRLLPSSLKWIILWNTMITIALAIIVLFSPGFVSAIVSASSFSMVISLLSPFLVAFLAGAAPFIYQIGLEEYKRYRSKKS